MFATSMRMIDRMILKRPFRFATVKHHNNNVLPSVGSTGPACSVWTVSESTMVVTLKAHL